MEKLQEYLATFDEEYEGVFAISLVDMPANEFDFVRLSKDGQQIVQLSVTDEEKRLVTGVVLVPDQKILRYDDKTKEHYYLVFKEEDILKYSREFIKKGYQKNSTENHDYSKQIANLTFVETWIVEDPQNDKANALGFNVPKGTWMVSGYVEDDDVLNKIKNKELNGFSIDGILKKVKTNLKKNTNMSLLDKLFALVTEEKKIEQLKEITTDAYGIITVEDLALDIIVYDADNNPLPNIEFEFEGFIYKTDDVGKIISADAIIQEEEVIDEVKVEEDDAEQQIVEVVMENGDVYSSKAFLEGEELFLNGELYVSATTDIEGHRITTDENGIIISNEAIIQEVDDLNTKIADMGAQHLAELEALKAENQKAIDKIAELEAQVTTLSSQPAVSKLKAINTDVPKGKEDKFDIFNRISASHKK